MSVFLGIGQVQHRREGVEHKAGDAVRHQQTSVLAQQRHHGAAFQQLALTIGQQGTAGAAGLLGTLGQTLRVDGVGPAGQAAALGRELLQHLVYAAAFGADGSQRNGVAARCKAFVELLLRNLFHREEKGAVLLPCAVDLLGQFGQAGFLRQQDGHAGKIRAGHALPCIQVQCTGVGDGGQRVPGRLAVIDAVHGKAGRHKTLGSGVQTGGIAGNLEGTSVIESCYNSGSIVGFNNYAGILGRGVGAAVKNSYTSGSIITYEGSTNVGYAIIGSSKSGGNCTVENSYALEGSGDALNYAKGVTADAASAYKSQSDMQSEAFAALLGSAFQYNEGAYPTLTWEVPAVEVPSAKVPFSLNPESAVLKINGESYTGSGTLTFTEAGEYPYTIEQTGYVS